MVIMSKYDYYVINLIGRSRQQSKIKMGFLTFLTIKIQIQIQKMNSNYYY